MTLRSEAWRAHGPGRQASPGQLSLIQAGSYILTFAKGSILALCSPPPRPAKGRQGSLHPWVQQRRPLIPPRG